MPPVRNNYCSKCHVCVSKDLVRITKSIRAINLLCKYTYEADVKYGWSVQSIKRVSEQIKVVKVQLKRLQTHDADPPRASHRTGKVSRRNH